jgi:hypothetical protein
MSNYTKSTNFATKDNLTPGDPLKVVRGTEIDTEFNNIATAIATKTDNASAAITGGTITGITDLAVADGGTGASTAATALNNLLPSQTSNANKYLQTDGTNATWDAVSLSTADITGTLGVANGGTGVTTSTGTTNVVLSNSPTLVTPALGTPSALVGTNITGTASGLTAGNVTTNANLTGAVTSVGNATSLGSFSSANLLAALTDETGTGSAVFATSPTLVTPALGTPSALVGTNITGTASGLTAGNVTTNANLTGAVTSVGNATSLGSFSSANLLGALTDETGTGSAVFATSPTLVTPVLGVATGTSFQGIIGNVTPAAGAFTTVTASTAIGTTSGGTGLTSFTSGGVVYASSSSALATGSLLTFDGTNTLKLKNTLTLDRYSDNTEGLTITTNTGNGVYNSFGGLNHVWQLVGTEAMRLTSSSLYTASGINVGIGTSSPASKLTVINTADANKQIVFSDNATYYGSVGHNSGNGLNEYRTEAGGGHGFFIGTSGTSNLLLNSSGNLGLGVTPSAWSLSGLQALQVKNGSIYGYLNEFGSQANTYYNAGWKYVANGYASQYVQASGTHGWLTAASGTAGDAISFTQAMTLDASGGLQTLNTIGVGNATPSTSGAGITFPATQSASSNANTLDDYEEGTWTAAFNVTSGSITISTSYNTGRYTKVGRLVTVNLHARFSSVSSPSGGLTISGLPFTSDSDAQCRNSGTCAALAVTSLATPMTAYVNNNSTSMTLSGFVAATGGYADAGTYINASSELYITLTYYV